MHKITKKIITTMGAVALLVTGAACGTTDAGGGGCEGAACTGDTGQGNFTAPDGDETPPAEDTAGPAPEDTPVPVEDTAPPEEDIAPPEEDIAPPPEDIPEPPAAEYVIETSELSTTAKFFSWQAPTATIKFFAVLDQAAAVHVAFDACDVCYGAKKGYSQEGDKMKCNNCGNKFAITGIGTTNKGGGCWPGYLPVTLTDEQVHIDHSDLESGAWYFK